MADIDAVKREQGIPADAVSCHTAMVDGYLVEGHVPADAIDRMLAERPDISGIAVPGMPAGTPGMAEPGQEGDYEVVTFGERGVEDIYERR